MKVEKGQTIYVGGKRLKEGDEIPEGAAPKVEKEKPKPKKPKTEEAPTIKP